MNEVMKRCRDKPPALKKLAGSFVGTARGSIHSLFSAIPKAALRDRPAISNNDIASHLYLVIHNPSRPIPRTVYYKLINKRRVNPKGKERDPIHLRLPLQIRKYTAKPQISLLIILIFFPKLSRKGDNECVIDLAWLKYGFRELNIEMSNAARNMPFLHNGIGIML